MKYSLVGVNGNIFAVIGYVMGCMQYERYSKKDVDEFYKKATSAYNYEQALRISNEQIEELNHMSNTRASAK